MAALLFLQVNGVDQLLPLRDLETTRRRVAAGNLGKAELAGWMRKQIRR